MKPKVRIIFNRVMHSACIARKQLRSCITAAQLSQPGETHSKQTEVKEEPV